MGYPKKPTALRLLQGNPGKRAINKDEPQPQNDLGEAPEELSEGAKKVWSYVLDESPPGVVKSTDAAELVLFCVAFDIYLQAYEQVKQGDIVVMTGKDMNPVINPYLKIMQSQVEIISKCGNNLGLNPVSRSKISVKIGGSSLPGPKDFASFKPRDRK